MPQPATKLSFWPKAAVYILTPCSCPDEADRKGSQVGHRLVLSPSRLKHLAHKARTGQNKIERNPRQSFDIFPDGSLVHTAQHCPMTHRIPGERSRARGKAERD